MKNFEELINLVSKKPKKTIAVAAAEDLEVLEAVIDASKMGIANFILFGNLEKLEVILKENNLKLESNIKLVNTSTTEESATLAVKSVSNNEADVLMKGLIDTNILLQEVLNKEYGLRTNNILSHVMMLELPKLKKPIFLTDGAMNINPDEASLIKIINNALNLVKSLGIEKPKVALISAVEKPNPKILSTITCSNVAMEFKNSNEIVEGPLALDLAINPEAAIIKNLKGKIQGDADILVVPYIEMGNALYKGWVFGCDNVKNAGVVVGAKKPIVLTSRADSREAKLYSLALSLIM